MQLLIVALLALLMGFALPTAALAKSENVLEALEPNPYQRDAIACYSATGEPLTGTACAATAATARTLAKCKNGIGKRGGCFGPSNTLVEVTTHPKKAVKRFEKSAKKKIKRLGRSIGL